MAAEQKWLWKATMAEKFFEVSNRHQTLTVSYQLTISTASPLPEEQVKTALSHLYRKTPNLRACYGERDGDVWIREMSQEKINFEVIPETVPPADVLHQLRTYRYSSSTGPLWCVKLRPGPPSDTAEQLPDFPHVYTIFLGFHHGITDGTSTVKICNLLVQLLNDILAGRPINDDEQLGIFTSGERTEKMVHEKVAAMKADPALLQQMLNDSKAHKTSRSVLNATYKDAGEQERTTKYITRDLDVETTAAFMKKCRAESVTVNTAFATLASVAIVDLLVLEGLHQDTYNLCCHHVVSVRRFWDGDTSPYLGCHILPPMPIATEVPKDIGDKFWDLARSMHKEIQSELKAGASLREEAIKNMFMPKDVNIDDIFQERPEREMPEACDFTISNMGDVTKLLKEGGDHVQATHVLRSVSIHKLYNNWSHLLHTFRGRLIHVLDYNTGRVNTQMAQTYCDRVFHHLHNIL